MLRIHCEITLCAIELADNLDFQKLAENKPGDELVKEVKALQAGDEKVMEYQFLTMSNLTKGIVKISSDAPKKNKVKVLFLQMIIAQAKAYTIWHYLLFSLEIEKSFDLVKRLITSYRRVTKIDWINVFKPIKYDFDKSWHYRVVYLISNLIYILAFVSFYLFAVEARLLIIYGWIALLAYILIGLFIAFRSSTATAILWWPFWLCIIAFILLMRHTIKSQLPPF